MISTQSDGTTRYRTALLICITLGALVAVGTVSAGIGGAIPTPTGDAIAPDSGEAVGADGATGSENSSTEQFVVRFEPLTETVDETTPEALDAHAEATQSPFVEQYEERAAIEIRERFWIANAVLVDVDTERISKAEIESTPGVTAIHRNFEIAVPATATAVPGAEHTAISSSSATGGETTYGVEMVRAPAVWEQAETRGEGVTVAVLDTGIDPQRADLTVEQWAAFDSSGERLDTAPRDVHGHGTHVAGTVLGDSTSGVGIGVAPAATLYGVGVTDEDGFGTFTQILAGMEWATTTEEVDILQMSLGSTGAFRAFYEPVTNAQSSGKLVVAAAGNDGHGTSSSPGNIYESLSVGAVGENWNVPAFSSGQTLNTSEDWQWRGTPPANWPDTVVVPDVSAPGVHVQSARRGSSTGLSKSSGTSMAAPHVSGVAALALSAADGPVDIPVLRDALRETSMHPDGKNVSDDRYGHGIVDAVGTVEAVADTQLETATFEVSILESNLSTSAGEELVVEAEVTNTGTGSGTQEIGLSIDGIGPIDTETITLDAGQTETVTLRWHTAADSDGEYTASVASEDSTDSRAAQVHGLTPAQFTVDIVDYDAEVTEGDAVTVTTRVENIGSVSGTQEIALGVDERGTVDAVTLLLESGRAQTFTLTWNTTAEDAGERTIAVTSADDEQNRTVTIHSSADGASDEDGSGFTAGVALAAVLAISSLLLWQRDVLQDNW